MVVKTSKKNKFCGQQGQAVFELVIFLPFLVFLYMIYTTTGNSISGSINQQKAVRGYFYALLRGNSYVSNLPELEDFSGRGIKSVGFSSVGWREKGGGTGTDAFAPCFQFSSILKNDSKEDCDDKTREEDFKTRNIRVFTFYGVCGAVYTADQRDGNAFFEIIPSTQNNPSNCSLTN